MTAPTADPVPPDADLTTGRTSRGVLRATPVIATVGVIVALLGIAVALLPVRTPTQDCGTALAFMLRGRVDELVSETDPPAGTTPAEAKANNAEPCRVRVVERTEPAAVLFASGLVAAVGAAAVELGIRFVGWRRRGYRRSPAR